jgi:uncharacterized protein YhbP (UPF0306 family)
MMNGRGHKHTDQKGQTNVSETIEKQLLAFLERHQTMALATVGPDGRPAVAPLYYAHDRSLRLYYLSNPQAQHNVNLEANPQVAATIYAGETSWQTIQGVQLLGPARQVKAAQLPYATKVYVNKYGFLRPLFADKQSGPAQLLAALARCRFYVVEPTWLRWIDNTTAFGHKAEWRIDRTSTDGESAPITLHCLTSRDRSHL